MQAALAGVVVDAQLLRRPGQAFMGVVADGAVAHGGKHDGHWTAPAGAAYRRRCCPRASRRMRVGLRAQKDPGLHGLPQGVDGGVGHLGGVDEHFIPVDGHRAGDCPWRRAARRRSLPGGKSPSMACPVQLAFSWKVLSVFTIFSARVGHRATQRWQLTHWLSSADHQSQLVIILVHPVGALALAHAAGDAAVLVAHHLICGIEEDQAAIMPCLLHGYKITGSPPRGDHTLVQLRLHRADGASPRWRHTRCRPVSATTMERSFSRSFRAIMPPSKPTRMEKGPVISRAAKAIAQEGHTRFFRLRQSGRWCCQKGAATTAAASRQVSP